MRARFCDRSSDPLDERATSVATEVSAMPVPIRPSLSTRSHMAEVSAASAGTRRDARLAVNAAPR
eukprot:scaffold181388_cov28-Tisochrysis_lutea.AAC.2